MDVLVILQIRRLREDLVNDTKRAEHLGTQTLVSKTFLEPSFY